MDTQAIRERIQALRAELESGGTDEAELSSRLQALDEELHTRLVVPGAGLAPDPQQLDEQVRALSLDFAERHPRLQPILTELTNLLANIGI